VFLRFVIVQCLSEIRIDERRRSSAIVLAQEKMLPLRPRQGAGLLGLAPQWLRERSVTRSVGSQPGHPGLEKLEGGRARSHRAEGNKQHVSTPALTAKKTAWKGGAGHYARVGQVASGRRVDWAVLLMEEWRHARRGTRICREGIYVWQGLRFRRWA
jgi:hypothetical protein